MDHENAQPSRLEAVVVASPKSPESDISRASEPQTRTQGLNTTPYYEGCDKVQINQTFGQDVEEPQPPKTSLVSHSCRRCPSTRVLFACIIGGHHTVPRNTFAPPPPPPNIAAYAYQEVHVWSALLTCMQPRETVIWRLSPHPVAHEG